jgi:hypothetical protein
MSCHWSSHRKYHSVLSNSPDCPFVSQESSAKYSEEFLFQGTLCWSSRVAPETRWDGHRMIGSTPETRWSHWSVVSDHSCQQEIPLKPSASAYRQNLWNGEDEEAWKLGDLHQHRREKPAIVLHKLREMGERSNFMYPVASRAHCNQSRGSALCVLMGSSLLTSSLAPAM